MNSLSYRLIKSLRALERDYPYGIPTALIERAAPERDEESDALVIYRGSAALELLVIASVDEQDWGELFEDHFAYPEGEFLQRVIEKGFGRSLDQIAALFVRRSVLMSASGAMLEELTALLGPGGINRCIVFGAELHRFLVDFLELGSELHDSWVQAGDNTILLASGLSEISSDASVKRKFWKDLQTIRG